MDREGARRELAIRFPAWEIWIVPHALGGETWCARRHDNHRRVLNADTADHLAEYITEAEQQGR